MTSHIAPYMVRIKASVTKHVKSDYCQLKASSEGKSIPDIEPPAQKVTHSGGISRIPVYLAKNYEFSGHAGEAE
eukprot:4656283-Ditylum_brightwellii.AAC.2